MTNVDTEKDDFLLLNTLKEKSPKWGELLHYILAPIAHRPILGQIQRLKRNNLFRNSLYIGKAYLARFGVTE